LEIRVTERLAGRVEQLESRVDRVENRMNGLASSTQVSELHARLDGLDSQINTRIDGMSSQINAHLGGMENRFNARLSDITRIGIALLLSVVGLIVAEVTQ
jgi:outer membrane murein-binding lipoprotein Lpp